MRPMILLFFSAYFCDAVVIRIKPLRIVSYRKKQPTNETISSAAITSATHSSALGAVTDSTTATIPMRFTTITTDEGTRPVFTHPLVTSASTSIKVQTAATTTSSPATVNELPKIASTWKSTSTLPASVVPATNLTDRAGFFHISSHTRLFYWFFRSKSKATDPVVVWLQGQPNASSMYGAFDETGPYFINPLTKRMAVRQHSWANSFNVLYLDPYPGCGFSHSDNPAEYSLSYERVAKGILRALKQFFALYPQLMANSLYLAAESVGAKYAIVVAHAILHSARHHRLNLKGVLFGGAVVDEYQLANYCARMLAFGLVDLKAAEEMTKHEDYMAALIRTEAYTRAAEHWHRHVFTFFTRAGYQSPYDVRSINVFWDSFVPDYMNEANVRKELKISSLKFQPAAKIYVTSETLKPLQILIRELLSSIKVLLYHGQFDMFAPITHSTGFLNKFNWAENLDFYTSKRKNWYIEKHLAGYWSSNENLTLLLIRNAGHMVGYTQPKGMLQMLKDFTSGKFEMSYPYHVDLPNWTYSENSIYEHNFHRATVND